MCTKLRFTTSIVLISSLLAGPLSVIAKDAKPPKLFSENTEMQVTLSGPWRRIKKNIKEDTLYPTKLTYTGADGEQHTIDVEAAPRGITRRFKVCDFPPLKIHFDKDKMKGTEFRGNKSLKLVTYCQTHSKYVQYYAKEFLVYRIYNLITEHSFRVRPMMIEYKDSERKGQSISRFSFLIEDLDDVAERNDLKKLSVAKISYKDLDPVEISKMSLFQYMVGNLDWATTDGPKEDECCHNAKALGSMAGPVFSVPYDFDMSGIINTRYSEVSEKVPIRDVRQRFFRGRCVPPDQMARTLQVFQEQKDAVYALYMEQPQLDEKVREKTIEYLDDFYEIIDDDRKVEREIVRDCRRI